MVKSGELLDGSEVGVYTTNIAIPPANNHGPVSFEMESNGDKGMAYAACLFIPCVRPGDRESLRRLSGRLDVNRTVLSPPFNRSIQLQPKRAFSAVDPVFLAPTAEDERQKSRDAQQSMEEEAARIETLKHGHHRTAKQPKLELRSAAKAVPKARKKSASLKKARSARKTATKARRAA